ncbi:piggybac transposable element-derived protein [Anaeramoeba flamelloides]|uniref:Piggybac transposable element-derived protein n=1 Tax=Anaeramoeba flamelloides TaxID=1746091 RepID=A0AAV7YPP7_9EUKA|nr:piggybac transposable element-derived protein [Anaeramoeba flamelloides]
MSRNLFEEIHLGWSFSYGKQTIFNFINLMNQKIQKFWVPSEILSLNESMIPSKSRSKHRRYLARKPRGNGLVVYGIADKCKYVYANELAIRNGDKVIDISLRLLNSLPKAPYHFYSDNHFSSLKNAILFDRYGYRYTCSCRSDRPKELFKEFLHKGIKAFEKKFAQTKIENRKIMAII